MRKISDLLKSKETLKMQLQEIKEIKTNEEKEKREIEFKIWEEQKKLNEKEREGKNQIVAKYKEIKENIEKSIEILKEDRKELEKICQLYEIKNNIVEDFEIYEIKANNIYNPIDILYNTNSLLLKAFIVKDKDKPKNFYSLSVYGNSIYNSDIIFKRFQGVFNVGKKTLNDKWSLTIEDNIKNFESEEKALLYFEKNKNKILERYTEYFEIEKLLQEVQELKEEEIRESFLTYKKEWFEHCYNEDRLKSGEYEEYNNILKELLNYK